MSFSRNVPAAMIPVGFQKITTNSTATALNSTCLTASSFMISIETQSARIRFDCNSTNLPAATTGILMTAANSPYIYSSVDPSKIKIARVTAGAVVQVAAFKWPSDKVSAPTQ